MDLIAGAIFKGNGTGTFTEEPVILTDHQFSVVGDLDNNEFPDLVLVTQGYKAVIYLNSGGAFNRTGHFNIPAGTTDLAIGDYDGNGIADFVTCQISPSLVFYEGKGDGSILFAPEVVEFSSNYSACLLSDLNGDGRNDLVLTRYIAPGGLSILLADQNGSFLPERFLPGKRLIPLAAKVADFNEDGLLDIYQYGSIFLQKSSGGFKRQRLKGAEGIMAAADFNMDGFVDIASLTGEGLLKIFLQQNNGKFLLDSTLALPMFSQAMETGDFNGDNRPDLVASGQVSGLRILINRPQ